MRLILPMIMLLVLGCAPKPRVIDRNDVRNQASVIVNERCGGAVSTERTMFTAGHCVHSDKITYKLVGDLKTDYSATVIGLDAWSDLAELRLDDPFKNVSYTRRAFLNENVTLVHHRCKGGWCHEKCKVINMSASLHVATMDCNCQPRDGMSGSGIWGEDNALVGIVTSVGLTTGLLYFTMLK